MAKPVTRKLINAHKRKILAAVKQLNEWQAELRQMEADAAGQ